MNFKDIIRMALDEYMSELRRALDGLTPEERRFQPDPESHHIDFAVWHMARVEDDWVQRFAQRTDAVWNRDGWPDRLGLPAKGSGHGYNAEQVTGLPSFDIDQMMAYYDAVREATLRYLDGLSEADLDATPHPGAASRLHRRQDVQPRHHRGEPARRPDCLYPGYSARPRQVRHTIQPTG